MSDGSSVPRRVFPPSDGWLTAPRVEYMRNFLALVLMALAVPYIVMRIFSSPASVVNGTVANAVL